MPIDALKRFTSTPFQNSFKLHGSIFSVATNYQSLADRLLGALVRSEDPERRPAFAWRVVVEPGDDLEMSVESSRRLCFKQNGLVFVTLGQKNFLAWDMQANQGVSFLSTCIVDNERLFQQFLLPALTSLPKESPEVS